MKKNIFCLGVAAIFSIMVMPLSLSAQALSFSVRLSNTNYNKGEPVKCTLEIKNTSKTAQVVNNRFLVNLPNGPCEVSLIITGPDQRLVPFASLVRASFKSDEFVSLAPGATTSSVYTITSDFDLLKTGYYTITGYYFNDSDPAPGKNMGAAWKGTLVSQKINFMIR